MGKELIKMDYQKVIIEIKPDNQDFRDLMIAQMGEAGFESFVENETTIEAYIPHKQFKEELLLGIDMLPLFSFSYTEEVIKDRNWNEVWETNYFKPLLVANRCLVRAPFHNDYPEAEFEIIIEPKMAFGTGNHETTALMMEFILDNEMKGHNILDMGCGTGILAMLASMRGAQKITAIDIDEWAWQSTVENAVLNQCNNIDAFQGDAALLGQEQFDMIFANIHKNILISDVEQYSAVLKTNGLLFMSGFYESDLEDIKKAAASSQLTYIEHKSGNKWVAAAFKKK